MLVTFVEARLDAAGNPSMHLIVWLTGNVRMYAWRVLGRKFLLAMRAKNAFWWADAEAHRKRQKVLVSAMPQSEDAHNFSLSLSITTPKNNTQEYVLTFHSGSTCRPLSANLCSC